MELVGVVYNVMHRGRGHTQIITPEHSPSQSARVREYSYVRFARLTIITYNGLTWPLRIILCNAGQFTTGLGNQIYLTEERWQHILERHDELTDRLDSLLDTVR
jgi:hypothetical protein